MTGSLLAPARTGQRRASPGLHETLPGCPTPDAMDGPSAPAPRSRRRPWPSPSLGSGSAPSTPLPGKIATPQPSLHAAGRPVASTPLRRRPLDRPTGLHCQGPSRLPGPDPHRLSAVSLSLGPPPDEIVSCLIGVRAARRTSALSSLSDGGRWPESAYVGSKLSDHATALRITMREPGRYLSASSSRLKNVNEDAAVMSPLLYLRRWTTLGSVGLVSRCRSSASAR
jgi:hypothetical protein